MSGNTAYVAVNGNAVNSSVVATPSESKSNSTTNTYSFSATGTPTGSASISSTSDNTATVKPTAGGTYPIKVTLSSNNYNNCEATFTVNIDNYKYTTSGSGTSAVATIIDYCPKTAGVASLSNTITVGSTTYKVTAVGNGSKSIFATKQATGLTMNANLVKINANAFYGNTK